MQAHKIIRKSIALATSGDATDKDMMKLNLDLLVQVQPTLNGGDQRRCINSIKYLHNKINELEFNESVNHWTGIFEEKLNDYKKQCSDEEYRCIYSFIDYCRE